MDTMTELLRRNLPPAAVMDSYARENARRPRNAPCSCGSGRKWKYYHGRPRTS